MKKQWKKFLDIKKQCQEKFNVDEEILKNRTPIPESQKCFYHCMSEKYGFMDAEGKITIDKFKAENPGTSDDVIENHKSCIEGAKATDKCDKAKEISDCIKEKHEKSLESFIQNKKECDQEFGLSEDDFKSWSVPDDKKCFFKCLAVKLGRMNEQGEFTLQSVEKTISAGMKKNLEECAKTSKMDDPCDTAKAFSECLREKYKHWRS